MATTHMSYPVAIDTDAIGQHFDAQEMPLTLLIHRQATIAYFHAGVGDRDSFEQNIETLLR